MMRVFKGIIFDLDGTLADTLSDIADAVNAGLEAFGLPRRSDEDVRPWIGEGVPLLCQRAIGGRADIPLDEMTAIVREQYRASRLNKVKLYPGVPELLDELVRRKILLAILTNKPHEHTEAMCAVLFARWPLVAVEGYRQEEFRKPDPRVALSIVEKMSLTPEQVMLVGDSSTDILTAKNAGLTAVGATWGYRARQELIDSGAKHLIDQADELLALL